MFKFLDKYGKELWCPDIYGKYGIVDCSDPDGNADVQAVWSLHGRLTLNLSLNSDMSTDTNRGFSLKSKTEWQTL